MIETSVGLVRVGPHGRISIAGPVGRSAVVIPLALARDDKTVRLAIESNALSIASTEFDLSVGCLVSHTVQRLAVLRKASGIVCVCLEVRSIVHGAVDHATRAATGDSRPRGRREASA